MHWDAVIYLYIGNQAFQCIHYCHNTLTLAPIKELQMFYLIFCRITLLVRVHYLHC